MHRAESIPTNETYPLANIRLDRINQSRPDDPICLPSTSKKNKLTRSISVSGQNTNRSERINDLKRWINIFTVLCSTLIKL